MQYSQARQDHMIDVAISDLRTEPLNIFQESIRESIGYGVYDSRLFENLSQIGLYHYLFPELLYDEFQSFLIR